MNTINELQTIFDNNTQCKKKCKIENARFSINKRRRIYTLLDPKLYINYTFHNYLLLSLHSYFIFSVYSIKNSMSFKLFSFFHNNHETN